MMAAMYAAITLAIAPISYGPVQLRVANVLKPVALFSPAHAVGLAIGTALANLASPFGPWDYVVMPLVDFVAALACWQLRRWSWLAVTVQSVIVSVGVSMFPLGMGAGLPFTATFPGVVIGGAAMPLVGLALIWKRDDIAAMIGKASI